MPGKLFLIAPALLLLIALAPLPVSGQPQAKAWLVVEDYGNDTIAPSLYITGLAPPGAIAFNASIEATNDTATLIIRAQSTLAATILSQRGIRSLALTLVAYKQTGASAALGRGRLDAATTSGNITIGLIQAGLDRSGEKSILKITLSDIEGNATPASIASTLNRTLGALPLASHIDIRLNNDTVTIELALPEGFAALTSEDLEWNATLILIASGGILSLSVNASLHGDVHHLAEILAPREGGYRPVMPAKASASTLSNGTLLVRLPNLKLEGSSPEEVAASIAGHAGELLGGNVSYTIRSASSSIVTGQGTSPSPATPSPKQSLMGEESGDKVLVAVSGVIVVAVVLLLLARVRH